MNTLPCNGMYTSNESRLTVECVCVCHRCVYCKLSVEQFCCFLFTFVSTHDNEQYVVQCRQVFNRWSQLSTYSIDNEASNVYEHIEFDAFLLRRSFIARCKSSLSLFIWCTLTEYEQRTIRYVLFRVCTIVNEETFVHRQSTHVNRVQSFHSWEWLTRTLRLKWMSRGTGSQFVIIDLTNE
jgi:hypothetical protein